MKSYAKMTVKKTRKSVLIVRINKSNFLLFFCDNLNIFEDCFSVQECFIFTIITQYCPARYLLCSARK